MSSSVSDGRESVLAGGVWIVLMVERCKAGGYVFSIRSAMDELAMNCI